jgi:hypothetical protein
MPTGGSWPDADATLLFAPCEKSRLAQIRLARPQATADIRNAGRLTEWRYAVGQESGYGLVIEKRKPFNSEALHQLTPTTAPTSSSGF